MSDAEVRRSPGDIPSGHSPNNTPTVTGKAAGAFELENIACLLPT